MLFNFNNGKEEILKLFLEQKELNIVFTGSYSLYNIKNKDSNFKIENILLNDIDVDLYKEINKEIDQNIYKKELFKKINNIIENKIDPLLNKLQLYKNVLKYETNLSKIKIYERKYNNNTFGISLEIKVFDKFMNKYTVDLDLKFENKDFKIDIEDFVLQNKQYKVNTYSYSKILADKYLALNKHLSFLFSANNEIQIEANMYKISKDIYDIVYLKSKEIDKKELESNISKMWNINSKLLIQQLDDIVDEVVLLNPQILKTRGYEKDFYNVLKKFNNYIFSNNNVIEI